jgi:hypothetical protein
MNNCFICLEKCNHRVCNVCQCYAHNECWGKFLKSKHNILTYLYKEYLLILSPYSVNCPICKNNILNIKPVTRSDTKFYREIMVTETFFDIEEILDGDIKNETNQINLEILFKFLFEHKLLIKYDYVLSNIIKNYLLILDEKKWKSANLFYYKMFGKQIS